MPIVEIERHMLRRRVQRVLVVRDGEAFGVIAAADVLRAVSACRRIVDEA